MKQGGLATQQADAAAEATAARLGAPRPSQPFRPVLRAVLLTGSAPLYLHDDRIPPKVAGRPLWWPPGKIAGRYLPPYLAQLERPPPDPPVFEDPELQDRENPASAGDHYDSTEQRHAGR